jgi:hypothetical protein
VPLGRRTVKTEPLPGSLVTVTSPPIMRASLRERRHFEAESLGGSEIDNEFEFRGLFDRNLAGSGTLENFVDECRRASEMCGVVCRSLGQP